MSVATGVRNCTSKQSSRSGPACSDGVVVIRRTGLCRVHVSIWSSINVSDKVFVEIWEVEREEGYVGQAWR